MLDCLDLDNTGNQSAWELWNQPVQDHEFKFIQSKTQAVLVQSRSYRDYIEIDVVTSSTKRNTHFSFYVVKFPRITTEDDRKKLDSENEFPQHTSCFISVQVIGNTHLCLRYPLFLSS